MSIGIVMVHGYTGSSHDLEPLRKGLSTLYPSDSIRNILLPGHNTESTPEFDKKTFIACIWSYIEAFLSENRKIVLIGHSTGGIFLLSAMMEHSFEPHMLVLAGVPKKIDMSYLERWQKLEKWNKHPEHIDGNGLTFRSIAELVSLINSVGSSDMICSFPVLILHGELDPLVPANEALVWKKEAFNGVARTVIVPGAGHNLFEGDKSDISVDIVQRALADIYDTEQKESEQIICRLSEIEEKTVQFLSFSPYSRKHLASCPSGRKLVFSECEKSVNTLNEPVFANIEITTHCNLKCRYCARTVLDRRQDSHMSLDMFCHVLEFLPHAYRIMLVGLGEPLLHPHVFDIVNIAASQGRHVGIVTNAMCLDKTVSRDLINAGLDSITFSIDFPEQDMADRLRAGTVLEQVLENIEDFVEISRTTTRAISKSVFTAVSIDTVQCLGQLIDMIAELGVDVMMLTDLNFAFNTNNTLWKNDGSCVVDATKKAVIRSFSRNLPILSVCGLEEFGLADRYQDYLLFPPGRLYRRSTKHTWCFSPWQTLPVDVNGNITICDCQPENIIGNLFKEPFSKIWNGEKIEHHRMKMIEGEPPEACRICPRF